MKRARWGLLGSILALLSLFTACGSGGGAGTLDGSAADVPGSTGGHPTISLGVPVSGTVDLSDRTWYVIGPPPRNGYQDIYQMEVTAGVTYTVSCLGNTVEIKDADAFGEFTAAGGDSSVAVECLETPATWLPLRTGTATIDVLALADEVPTSYSVTFSGSR
jgi:hypothetical protein